MAPTKLVTHIPPDANPASVTQLILILNKYNLVFESVRDLLDYAEAQGLAARTEIQSMCFEMGLLKKHENKICISDRGQQFAQVKEDVRPDILHFLMYTSWHESRPLEFLPSWAYRDCCNRYWSLGDVALTSNYLDRQVEETINNTRETFSEMNIGEFDEISFSRKSLSGARKWLDALQPPVITENVFTRRAFCPPELMILAISYALSDDPEATDFDILLSRERREHICRICLLEPDALDRTLDWALSVFPKLIEPGTSAGTYGRFIRLHKVPTIEDIVR